MLRIVTQRAEAEQELRRLAARTHSDQVIHKESTVREILLNVRRSGDEALVRYTLEFDQVDLQEVGLAISKEEMARAYKMISANLLKAIRLAHQRIEAFHRERVPKSWVTHGPHGIVLGKKITPVDVAGLYIPGGRASYPSTVLMNAVPAKVAGVPRIVMVTPPSPISTLRNESINPAVLVAAQEAGIKEIYRVGGAQAVGALAYGTQTIPKVDVITGPGNIYVTLAKKLVYGEVGIDSLAGPSEVLVIADHTANPLWVATDLLAQAEHDPLASAILLTTSETLAHQVVQEVEKLLKTHERRTLTEKSIANYGLIVITPDLEEAAELSNLFAPEHLELEIEDPWALLPKIRHAGAVFLGHHTPEAVGDYLAGPNHTLPTSGAARYSSALSVETFLKSTSLIHYSPEALAEVAGAIDELTWAEGLPSHGDSVRFRLGDAEKSPE
ncbi:MAG: histidinol dehydrogenase [Gloeobacterales cyanobacterium]